MNTVVGLLAVFALVFVNGFFVAAEFAFVGARRTRIAQLAAEGHTGARSAQRAIQQLDSYIAATQLGITLASLGLGWIGEPALGHLVESLLEGVLPADLSEALGAGFSFAIAFSIVTVLVVTLGELAPKSIALQRPEGTAVIVARPTTAFLRVFRPIIYVMNGVGNGVVRLLGFEPASGRERVHSAEELVMLVHSSREAGLLEDTEERLLQRAFDFSDLYLRDVMQPRVEVEGIPVDAPLPVVLQRVASGTFSRYPVYKDSLDQVLGVLHAKDLFDAIVHEPALVCGGASFDLRSVLRTPLYFPEMANAGYVLEQMQRAKMPFCVVVDEFGGMAGIATMEDILEELVGEVQDEFDIEPSPTSTDAEAPLLDGLTTLADIAERFGDPGCEVHSATIGGYVAECLDRIPTVGDRVRYGEYEVIVRAMDEMRVAQVQFVPRARQDEDRPSQVESTT